MNSLFLLQFTFSYVHSLFVIASEYFSLASILDYLRERFVHLYVLCFSFFSFLHSEFSLTFSSFKSSLRLFQCLDSREKIVTVDMSRNSKSQSLSIDSSSTSESSAQHQRIASQQSFTSQMTSQRAVSVVENRQTAERLVYNVMRYRYRNIRDVLSHLDDTTMQSVEKYSVYLQTLAECMKHRDEAKAIIAMLYQHVKQRQFVSQRIINQKIYAEI